MFLEKQAAIGHFTEVCVCMDYVTLGKSQASSDDYVGVKNIIEY